MIQEGSVCFQICDTALERIPDARTREQRHLSHGCLRDTQLRIGIQAAILCARGWMAIIHPGVTQKVLAIQSIFNSRMDIQNPSANTEIPVEIRINPVVCGAANGVHPV